MRKLRIKKISLIILVAIFSMTFISFGTQLGSKKVLDVWQGAVKVNYNNQDVTTTVTPVIIDGATYLPLRKMTALFNKSLLWNDSTKTAIITDNTSTNATVNDLKNQIAIKDADIARLKEEIKNLTNKTKDIESVEDELNYEYGLFRNADFTIILSGDEDDIVVKIKTDEDDWAELSSSIQEGFLQSIVDDILDEFEDAEIEGIVQDGSNKLVDFSVDTRGYVDLEDVGGSVYDLYDTLNDKLVDDYFGEMRRIDNDDLFIKLEGDTEDLIFFIKIDLDYYDSQWEYLVEDKDDIEDFMTEIYEYIEEDDDFEDAEIIGYFIDDDDARLIKIYKSGSSLRFAYFN